MEFEHERQEAGVESAPPTAPENYGLDFHKWPLGIAVGVTLVLYGLIWFFVDSTPTYIDPTQLPPPPGSF